jgi:hypothetical protein
MFALVAAIEAYRLYMVAGPECGVGPDMETLPIGTTFSILRDKHFLESFPPLGPGYYYNILISEGWFKVSAKELEKRADMRTRRRKLLDVLQSAFSK